MILPGVFERFAEKTPVPVMARAAIEYTPYASALDHLFDHHSDEQYARTLLCSSVFDPMSAGVSRGMAVAISEDEWAMFGGMSPEEFAARMTEWANKVRMERFRKHPRRTQETKGQTPLRLGTPSRFFGSHLTVAQGEFTLNSHIGSGRGRRQLADHIVKQDGAIAPSRFR